MEILLIPSVRRSLRVFLLLVAVLLAPKTMQAQCAGFYAGVDSLQVVKCKGDSTGKVKLAAVGGTAPYQYARGSGLYGSTSTFSNLPAGTYTFHIKDANNCIADTLLTVAEPADALSGYVNGQAPICNGLLGTAKYYPDGGWVSAYYLTSLDGSVFDTATVYQNVAVGKHGYAIQDSVGCTVSDSFTIAPFSLPFSTNLYSPNCSGQYGDLFVFFGQGGSSVPLDPVPDSIKVQVGTRIKRVPGNTVLVQIDSLSPGNIALVATRYYPTFSCADTAYLSIDTPVQTLFTTTVQTPACFGDTSGRISVQVTAGVPPYQYAIDSGLFDTTSLFTGLAAGSHVVYVQNAYECQVQDTVVIAAPDSLSATFLLTPIACNGGGATGKAVIIPAGGTPPYSYKLGAGTYSTLDTFSNLAAGNYTVLLRDSNSCTRLFSFTITAPATALSLSTVVSAGSCSGAASGSITVTGTGGTVPYRYALGAGTYSATNTFTGLAAGSYTVRIQDTNGCMAQRTDTISQPGGPTLSFTQTNVLCNGASTGSITASGTGGTTPYTFALDMGSYSATNTFTGLSAGSYTLRIKDSNGCTAQVAVILTQPTVLTLSTTQTSSGCSGATGSITATGAGGVSPYTFALNAGTYSATNTFTGLSAGTYTVRVKDANNCTAQVSVTISSSSLLAITNTQTNVLCNGGTTGSITATGTGGTTPYTFAIGAGSYSTTNTFTGLSAGSYTVRVKDSNNCTSQVTVNITQPAVLALTSLQVNVLCNGASTGSITATGTGGTTPYTFAIGTGTYSTTNTFTGLSAGTYTLRVKDSNSCVAQVTVVVTQPPVLSVTTTQVNGGCTGANGSITATGVGGTSPYTFAIGTGTYSTTNTFAGLAAGSYIVRVKDTNNCTAQTTVVIIPSAAPTLATTQTNVLCNGDTTGSITASGTGGTTPYTFAIGTGSYSTTNTFTGLSAGSYTVRIKDSNSCTAQVTVTITQPALLVLSSTQTNVLCNGGTTGSITASGTGGTSPYTFALGTGSYATINTFTGLSAGSYTLRIKDANGCVKQSTLTLTQPTAVTLTTTQTNVLCNGGTGSITATGVGGTSPYTFAIGAGTYSTSNTFTGLAAGSYIVRVKDANNCTAQVSVTLIQPATLSVATAQTNVLCNGDTTGSITATGTGGTMPYRFALNAGTYSATNVFTGLAAGSYIVRIKDTANCMAQTTVTLTQPTALTLATTQTSSGCSGGTGSITASGSGGVSPYTFALNAGTYSATNTFTGLSAGTYTVRAKDANNCTAQVSVTISSSSLLALATAQTNVLCNGGTTGSITASGSGGTSPYTFAIGTGTYSATNTFTGLTAGSYTIFIKDANNCTSQTTVTLTQPPALSITTTQVNGGCNGGTGSITASGSGGVSPYTYALNAGTYSTTNTFTGLAAGSYTVRVKDTNNCTAQTTVVITPSAAPTLATTQTNVLCNGDTTSSITVSGTGGTTPYTYAIGTGTYSTTNTFTGLAAGSYTVRIKDSNSCTAQVTVVITQPTVLTLATTQTSSGCGGATGGIMAMGAGGVSPYTYAIGAGTYSTINTFTGLSAGTYTVRAKDANNCTAQVSVTISSSSLLALATAQTNVLCNGGTTGSITATGTGGTTPYTYAIGAGTYSATNTFTGLTAGSYTVRIKDSNSCTAQVSVNITQPAVLNLSTTQVNLLCSGGNTGSITATGAGGTTPYTYAIGAGTYSTTNTFMGLTAGSYTVRIKDSNNCTSQTTLTITQPAVLNVTSIQTNVLCNGGTTGSITATGAGGTTPYTYAIGTGTYSASNTFTGLAAGIYTVRIKDSNNCTSQVSVNITQPAALALTSSQVNVLCNGATTGSITATGAGGTTPYTYALGAGTYSTTNTFTGLAAGSYTVRIKDSNNCISQVNVTLTQPTLLTLTTTQTSSGCSGATGSITASGVGGISPYTYAIGAGTYSASNTFTGLSAGTYTVRVKDANNCTAQVSVTVAGSSLLAVATTQVNVLCNGGATGSITATGTGGTTPYTFAIGSGTFSTTNAFTGLSAGSYTIFIKDANNCTSQVNVTLTEPPVLALTTTQVNGGCNGNTGSITATGVGGTSPYTFAIGAGTYSAANTFTGLAAGSYIVRVKDANNCTSQTTVVITPAAAPTLATMQTNVFCNGASTGSITATGAGGATPYTYAIGTGTYSASNTFTGLTAGSYTVFIKDANNCTAQTTVTLTQPTVLTLTTTQTSGGCNGNTGSITATGAGGVSPYTFALNAGTYSATNTFTGLAAGTYTVRVKDANNCTAQVSVTISSSSLLAITTMQTNVLCNGASTGSITGSGTGGTTPYTFAIGTGPFSTTNTFTGLSAGSYTIFIKDANNCTAQTTVTLTQPAALTVTANQINAACNGNTNGRIKATGSGGTSPYTFALGSGTYGATDSFSNLTAGSYIVRIKDANSCTSQVTVVITQPAILAVTTTQVNVDCNGNATGSITATGTGGSASYKFAIDAGTYTAGNTFTGLAAGTYTVRVQDANGCTAQTTVVITQPAPLGLTTTQVNLVCNGANNGIIYLSPTGGTAPYSSALNNGIFTSGTSFSNLPAGTYTVYLRDANGCMVSVGVTLTAPPVLTLTGTATAVACNGTANGSLTVTASGGIAPYTYSLNGGTFSPVSTFSGLSAGTYTLQVKDANGCTAQTTLVVTQPAPLTATLQIVQPSCSGTQGRITVVPAGGTAPYTYLWNTGATSATISNLGPGTYRVTTTDARGCSRTDSAVLTSPTQYRINLGPDRTLCRSQALNLNADINVAGTQYLWTSTTGFTSTSPAVTIRTAGEYRVQATTPEGCKVADTIVVNVSTDTVVADFVAATQAFKDSLYTLVNISSPAPDSVQWILPPADICKVLTRTKTVAELVFQKTGTYEVSLKAFSGACFEVNTKKIVVVEGIDVPPVAAQTPFIKQFGIAPNPSSGVFEVQLELRQPADALLQVIEVNTGTVVDRKLLVNVEKQTVSYNLQISTGTYILLLQTANVSRSLKLLIQ